MTEARQTIAWPTCQSSDEPVDLSFRRSTLSTAAGSYASRSPIWRPGMPASFVSEVSEVMRAVLRLVPLGLLLATSACASKSSSAPAPSAPPAAPAAAPQASAPTPTQGEPVIDHQVQ